MLKSFASKALENVSEFEKKIIDLFEKEQFNNVEEFCILFPIVKNNIFVVPVVLNNKKLRQIQFTVNDTITPAISLKKLITYKIKEDSNAVIVGMVKSGNYIEKFEDSIKNMYTHQIALNEFCILLKKENSNLFLIGIDLDKNDNMTEIFKEKMSNYLIELLKSSL